MATMITITQAADQLGMSARRVREICAEHDIGTLVSSRLRILGKSDLPRISRYRRPVGNPNFRRRKSK